MPKSCPWDGCVEERYSDLGIEYHLARDHGSPLTSEELASRVK